jgi:hypothetical protein
MSDLTQTVQQHIQQRRYGLAVADLWEARIDAVNESNVEDLREVLKLAREVASAADDRYRARAEEIVRLAEAGVPALEDPRAAEARAVDAR